MSTPLDTASPNGYRLQTTISIIPISYCSVSDLSESLARMPPKISGWRVFTRPSIISGNFVISSTSVTAIPFSDRILEVPPVETISIPFFTKELEKSSIADLSLTLISTLATERRSNFCFSDCMIITMIYSQTMILMP